ncbi:HAMP domain-containing protein [Celeribacter sp. HF31]|uniref:methyl-accepting chemotaxis protein n=1 Tax=Celeribacter sp. HF31 TaxID=2721558 RepID=UPI00142F64CD|nr:methyl-accepting chemotaxis protein [Celeribacter sp. HF31]NIY78630.1 HAMP domain-containing protein [Celeribacter sp. HF31]
MSLRMRIIAAILGTAVFAAVVVVVPMLIGTQRLVSQGSARELDLIEKEMTHAIEAEISKAGLAAALVAGIPEIGRAMAEEDRPKLDEMFARHFPELQADFAIAQFQFHTPDAHSMFRVHKPEKFGDDLSEFRKTVVSANDTQAPVAGLERGRAGLGIRGLAPISDQGRHVGTVEIGLDLGAAFFDALVAGSQTQMEFYTLPDQSIEGFGAEGGVVRGAATFDGPDVLTEQDILTRAQQDGGEMIRRTVGEVSYVSQMVLLHDFSGDAVAVVHVMVPLATYQAISNEMQIMALVAGAVALLLGALLAMIFGGRISNALGDMIRQMQAIASGDTAVDLARDMKRGGELGRMASALEVFRKGLIEAEALRAEEAAARARIEAAEADQRAREDAQRLKDAEQAQMERDREAALAAEKEADQRLRDAERQAREDEQRAVMDRLAAGLKKLSEGNLDATVAEVFPESYEPLRHDFNETVTKLNGLIGSIREAVQSIVGNVHGISEAATDLSRRTESSAATLEETATAVNEITSSVRLAADGAKNADKLVQDTNEKAQSSSQIVSDTVVAMSEIEASSSKIGKIIDVIDDIAFQTNLLALNAGVEAARAGEAGRGFAVVASEVRELAQRSSRAAHEINDLISSSEAQVKHGVALVDRAGDALRMIADMVKNISSHVGEISSASLEQAKGIEEINSAIFEIEQTLQQNAAMSEETSAGSTNLIEDATRLRQLVDVFRMADQGAQAQTGWDEVAQVA